MTKNSATLLKRAAAAQAPDDEDFDPRVIRAAEVLQARRRARVDLDAFMGVTHRDYGHAWHQKLICKQLQRIERKEINRLMIMMPPGHWKSTIASRRFPAWYLGKRPHEHLMAGSYNDDLATDFGEDVRNLVASSAYQVIFPGLSMRADSKAKTKWNTDQGGSYAAGGVGGAFTGRRAHGFIVDDPIKGRAEADSESVRNKTWKWLSSTVETRLEPGGWIILILTRWHEDDPAGRYLEAMEKGASQWEILRLPAIMENLGEKHPEDPRKLGEALWGEDEKGKHFTLGELQKKKADLGGGRDEKGEPYGGRDWDSLYQQKPSPEGGVIILKPWIQYWLKMPKEFDELIQSWDLAFTDKKKSSYVVGQCWGRLGTEFYLLDQFRAIINFPQTLDEFKKLTALWPTARIKLVENKANGPALEATLKGQIAGILLWEPEGDKVARLQAVAYLFKAKNVFLPSPSIKPWMKEYENELLKFPRSTHKDQVDTTSQALRYFDTHNVERQRKGWTL